MAERIRAVVTVKAYPAASVKYGESVCVAGIRTDVETPEWVRLYPVDYRDLPIDKRFAKYEEISLDVSASSDSRPESLRPDTTTIEVVRKISTGRDRTWRERRRLVEPLVTESMCTILEDEKRSGSSLGAFRPARVEDVIASKEGDWTDRQMDVLNQMTLFAQDKGALERIPWRFRYRYSCGGTCRGHEQSIIDWEIHQAYRSWRRDYGDAEAVERVRRKWLDELCGPSKDTIFFVGNQLRHREAFLVLGVFWPPRSENGENLQFRF
jgi:hypothetical protein